jgi:hypothetical protein
VSGATSRKRESKIRMDDGANQRRRRQEAQNALWHSNVITESLAALCRYRSPDPETSPVGPPTPATHAFSPFYLCRAGWLRRLRFRLAALARTPNSSEIPKV